MARGKSREITRVAGRPGPLKAPDLGWETVGEVSRIAEASVELVRRYDRKGLISSVRDAYGRRRFPEGTGLRVRELKRERTARMTPLRSA